MIIEELNIAWFKIHVEIKSRIGGDAFDQRKRLALRVRQARDIIEPLRLFNRAANVVRGELAIAEIEYREVVPWLPALWYFTASVAIERFCQ